LNEFEWIRFDQFYPLDPCAIEQTPMRYLEHILRYTTYLFLFLFPWQTILLLQERFVGGVKWEYGTIGLFTIELLGWVVALLFMMWYTKKNQKSKIKIQNFRWSKDRIFLFSLLLFISYGLLSSFLAGDSALAFQHGQWVMLGTLLFLLFYIGPVKVKPALWVLVLGSIPVSLLGIWQFLTQSTFASTLLGVSQHVVFESGTSIIQSPDIGRWLRAYGSFSHPNVFGGYLVFSIASTLLLSFSVQRWKRVGLQAMVVVQSAALFFTFSRSAWMSTVIVIVSYGVIVVRKKMYRRLAFVVSILLTFSVLSFIYMPLMHTRFFPTSQNEISSITERVAGYSNAITLFQEHWLFGVGGGNYTYAFMQLEPSMPVWWYQPVHNVGVLFVVEYGVLGILLLGFVIVNCMRNFPHKTDLSLVEKLVLKHLCSLKMRNFGLYIGMLIPMLSLDHYLWSSFTGVVLLFAYSGLYMRYISYEISPHVVPI